MSIKSKIVSVILSLFLLLGAAAPSYSAPSAAIIQVVSKTLKLSSNSERDTVLKKFLKSMLLVAGSCTAIFLLLILYKRTRKTNQSSKQPVDISKNLNSPESIDAATKFFIEKF